MPVPHPDYPRIATILATCATVSLDRVVYRAVPEKYARDKDLLSGEGSIRAGGRWNAVGQFRVAYASFDEHTALAELNAKFISFGFQPPERKTIVPLKVRLQRVVELHVLAPLLGLIVEDLITADWKTTQDLGNESISQAIGRAAHELSLQAILTPSDRYPNGINLVLFCRHFKIPKDVEILDPDGL